MARSGLPILVALLVALFAAMASAAVLVVDSTGQTPGSYATLQEAVDAARDGDLVEVVGGRNFLYEGFSYDKNITINFKIREVSLFQFLDWGFTNSKGVLTLKGPVKIRNVFLRVGNLLMSQIELGDPLLSSGSMNNVYAKNIEVENSFIYSPYALSSVNTLAIEISYVYILGSVRPGKGPHIVKKSIIQILIAEDYRNTEFTFCDSMFFNYRINGINRTIGESLEFTNS